MKKRRISPLSVLLVLCLLVAFAQASSSETRLGSDADKIFKRNRTYVPNGEFAIYLLKDNEWQESGRLSFDRFYTKRKIDLSSYAAKEGMLTVRLRQEGGGAAHIDAVLLGELSPSAIKGVEGELALKKVSRQDFDVIDAFDKSLEFTFSGSSNDRVLSLTARVEARTISMIPFQFPTENLYRRVDENASFYTYRINFLELYS